MLGCVIVFPIVEISFVLMNAASSLIANKAGFNEVLRSAEKLGSLLETMLKLLTGFYFV